MNNPSAPIIMVAYQDRWRLAVERWWDIGSFHKGKHDRYNQYNDWLTAGQPNGKFDYQTRARGVTLTYDKNPAVPYFVGHISARGLKPNFAYQLKLAGKPVEGSRGMGTAMSYVSVTSKDPNGEPVTHTQLDAHGQPLPINGDDWANQQLGYAGRWWDDTYAPSYTNAITDYDYDYYTTDTIFGYLFIGDFITDQNGDAEWNIVGNHSYHITWQGYQSGARQVGLGTFNISGQQDRHNPRHYYGYGSVAPSSGASGANGKSQVKLFYELEPHRPDPVTLSPGTYHCRLLITEETFHNDYYSGTKNYLGGTWKTVMATEDFLGDYPDTNPANDVVFTIS